MPDVTLKDTFDIYQKQSDSVHKLWAYFQVVSLAVLGYTVGSEKAQWSDWTYALIAGSYTCFALANQWVIVASQRELATFGDAVREAAQHGGAIGRMLVVRAVAPRTVAAFHTAALLIVLGAIGFTWVDRCRPTSASAPAAAGTGSAAPAQASGSRCT